MKPGRSICCKACTRRSNTLLKFAEISSHPKRKSSGLKAAYELLGVRSPGLFELLQSRARARLGCRPTIVPETHSESSGSLSTFLNLNPQTLKPETLATIRPSGKLADRSRSNSTYTASLEFLRPISRSTCCMDLLILICIKLSLQTAGRWFGFQAHCLECKVCKALLLESDAQCVEETLVEETKKSTSHSHLCRETLLMHSNLFHIFFQLFFNVISQCLYLELLSNFGFSSSQWRPREFLPSSFDSVSFSSTLIVPHVLNNSQERSCFWNQQISLSNRPRCCTHHQLPFLYLSSFATCKHVSQALSLSAFFICFEKLDGKHFQYNTKATNSRSNKQTEESNKKNLVHLVHRLKAFHHKVQKTLL